MSDVDRAVGAAYGAVRPVDDAYVDYPKRLSFLIDPDGMVAQVYDVADVATHADDVLADLRAATA